MVLIEIYVVYLTKQLIQFINLCIIIVEKFSHFTCLRLHKYRIIKFVKNVWIKASI
jgi:hypothetical protein